ncbi:hypothetical protein EW145_g4633 [Phellinidium pouzarii]|uniref:Zn(2)-C6 fungal-type domain-containing protein n=1 Tax=Phellinidium pouzarii TaxID=167371 RepID=A0A4S4L459_9AGAM|nr:hypothetical protein EW145_g4633 [Phellinidium pouzarii]
MFAADSTQPHVMKGDLLDLDFTTDMDHRKRRRNRTTQSCLNCHTSKRKCDRKRCIQLGLTGLCVYEVDDPALRDDPDLDETTRLRNRIAELESLVLSCRNPGRALVPYVTMLTGKPHPRWADPNFYEGDASDKWHTRSQKRGSITASSVTVKQRRMLSPAPEHSGAVIKTEPMSEMQNNTCYYRLSPSPPPQHSSNGTYSINIGQLHTDQFAPATFDASCVNGVAGAGGCSPISYSPSSSASSGLNVHSPSDIYRYDDACACTSDPATSHSFVALARQLEGMSNYLQHLPEHSQSRCSIFRRIQELRSILHGDGSPKSSTSPAVPFGGYDANNSDSLRSPVESDLMSVSASVPLSAPATPHSLHVLHWAAENGGAHHGGVHPYFAHTDVYAKAVGAYNNVVS